MPYIYKSGLQFGINETNIYGGASYVELTQAEYDALSDAEKHNGQIYFITDGNYDFLIVNDSVPVGSIQAYGGITAPDNWLICDGGAVSRTEYAELFQAIGITYGVGDGSTTFNLPDLRGKVAIGQSTTYELGASGGEETHLHSTGNHTLTLNEIPSHAHGYQRPVLMYGTGANAAWPSSGTNAKGSDQWGYSGTANAGGGGAHNHGNTGSTSNMQPYLVTNYIIKAKNPTVTSGQYLEAMELFYPVGSYYETADALFDPNTVWGGTWVREQAVIHPTGASGRINARNTDVATTTNTTSGHTVCTLKYTSRTGRIFIHADCAFFTSKNTSRIEVWEDGVAVSPLAITNSTSMQRGIITFVRSTTPNVEHTYTLHLIPQSEATATLPAYQTFTLYCNDLAIADPNRFKWHRTA